MKHCSRRQLLKTTLFFTALFSVPAPLLAATRPALTIPPLFEARRGKHRDCPENAPKCGALTAVI